MIAALALLCALLPEARAGDGPWTLNPGELNLYVGGDYYRYGEFHDGSGQTTELGSPLTAAGLTGVATMGLLRGLEVELVVPYESVRANDPESAFCTDGPRDNWCKSTGGLGDVSGQIKGRVLDELFTAPITLSLAGGFRTGEAYAGKRGRLTTLGDGQTDLGAGTAVGRSSRFLKRGWYRVGLTGWYWYRFPNAAAEGEKKPADEISFSADTAFSFGWPWAIGPAVYGFHRSSGEDISQLTTEDFMDLDVFSSLQATQIKVGGKLGIFGVRGRTVSLTVLRTVYARNNPSDTLAMSIGIGWFIRPDLTESLR